MTSRPRVWAVYLALYTAATVLFAQISRNPDVRIAHGVLTYLLLIIGASRQGGRGLSAAMVVLSYLAVDYFFVPPQRSLGGKTALNWIILIGFVLTGLLISALFDQLRRAVAVARERTEEVQRLSAERLQLEREAATARVLTEADRLKNALIGSIAHDLRSPIATLALLADPAGGFAPDVALARVSEESRRLSEFIATLQRFAAGGGGSGLRIERHDAASLVQTARRSSEALLTCHTLAVETPSPAPIARCDFTLAVQVLGNLLQNAARYSPPGSVIEVSCATVGSTLEIQVADRGPGLDPTNMERLFTPLRRKPGAWNETGPSEAARMGMGLSIARTFARAQGGDVTYRPRDGGGAVFVLRLPAAT